MTRALVSLLVLTTAASADQPTKKATKQSNIPPGVSVLHDVEYATTSQGTLMLDIYRPEGFDGALPTIVFVHGGGWKGGDKKSAARNAAWIVPDGYAVVSINYRLLDVAQWPAQIDDCYAAVRWVRDHAGDYGFDGDRIAAWGTSAGGHLVALMGTRRCPDAETTSSRVQVVCDWFGPADLLTMPPNVVTEKRTFEQVSQSNGARLLGAPVPTIPERAKDASALYHVTADDPPFLMMHGTEDPGVPIEQSKKLATALEAAGVPHLLHPVVGAGHGGKEFLTDESKQVVRSFFTTHLKK